jgi:hypothetical protein
MFGQSVPPGAPKPHSSDVPVAMVPNSPIQSPSLARPQLDPLELRREAGQVLQLSKSVQVDFEAIARGVLPKDTTAKLKKIEELSKHLRKQIQQ